MQSRPTSAMTSLEFEFEFDDRFGHLFSLDDTLDLTYPGPIDELAAALDTEIPGHPETAVGHATENLPVVPERAPERAAERVPEQPLDRIADTPIEAAGWPVVADPVVSPPARLDATEEIPVVELEDAARKGHSRERPGDAVTRTTGSGEVSRDASGDASGDAWTFFDGERRWEDEPTGGLRAVARRFLG